MQLNECQVIQSDLLIPIVEGHIAIWKGHLTIPKRSPAELPGVYDLYMHQEE